MPHPEVRICPVNVEPIDADNLGSDRPSKRKPFSNFMKRLPLFKSHADQQAKKSSTGGSSKQKKTGSFGRNNPYPQSGHLQPATQASQPSFGAASQPQHDSASYASLPVRSSHEHDFVTQSNKSGAPTLETNPETIHSDAGHSKAATTTTGSHAVSSLEGGGAGSTFSSPNHSERSLTTTLTTIHSTNALQHGDVSANNHSRLHDEQSQPNGTLFNQPFPATTASAIPRHLQGDTNSPNTYNSATANNLATDNASILTLASSSKQRSRRRSMDTDASVRALAPSSVWGGSRESLPLSVLSQNIDVAPSGSSTRPTAINTSGITSASAERASVYSSSGLALGPGVRDSVGGGGINSPALASERNSSYFKGAADAKSLRSITNLKDYDARSINNLRGYDDVASVRSLYAPSEAAVARHGRNDSIPGSAIAASPLASPALIRAASTSGPAGNLSRRGSERRPGVEENGGREAEESYFEKKD